MSSLRAVCEKIDKYAGLVADGGTAGTVMIPVRFLVELRTALANSECACGSVPPVRKPRSQPVPDRGVPRLCR